MSTLRIPVAMVTSIVSMLAATTTFAATPQDSAPIEEPAQPQPSAVQSVTVQPSPERAPEVVRPPAPTTTTAAPYVVSSRPAGDRVTERTIEHRPNRSLLSTGVGVFVLGYGASVVAGAMSDRSEDKRLFIPVAGPWIDLSNRHCTITAPCGSNEDFAKTMIVTSGVVQGVGALAALGSLIIPETTTIQERTTTSKALPPAKPEVHVFPISLAGGAGIGASGRF